MTHSGLEADNLLVRQGVGLGNDRDQVDLGVEASHNLNVQRLEGVASGLDEEDTGVNSVVNNVHSVDLVLSIEVGIETLLNVVDNGAPRLIVVNEVAKAGGVNDSQAQANTGLLNIGADGLDGDSLGDNVQAGRLALLGRVQGGVEQSVDQSRLAQTGLANNHHIEVEALSHTLTVPLVGKVGKSNIAGQLSSNNVLVVRNSSWGGGYCTR